MAISPGTEQVDLQDKEKEIRFFDKHALGSEYNVFSDETNLRIVRECLNLAGIKAPGKIADLGCGSGVFSDVLATLGFDATGVDLSPGMVELAQKSYPNCQFVVGDVEKLPFEDGSFDAVMLSGLLHHLPDPSKCVAEVWRILKPGGRFTAFDPNRVNPFMFLYRDKSSPFYSNKGVTENERPVLAKKLATHFLNQGFEVQTGFLSDLQYRYVASPTMRKILPIYNWIDSFLFSPAMLQRFRAFVLTGGKKPEAQH